MLTLTPDELLEVTGRVRSTAQARTLAALGIPYRLRPDGTVLVFRADLHATPNPRPTSPALRLPAARRVLAGQAR
ncbi:MAG: DUF4224 domain-containing protein [bacterium]|jgi:hypothetical protein